MSQPPPNTYPLLLSWLRDSYKNGDLPKLIMFWNGYGILSSPKDQFDLIQYVVTEVEADEARLQSRIQETPNELRKKRSNWIQCAQIHIGRIYPIQTGCVTTVDSKLDDYHLDISDTSIHSSSFDTETRKKKNKRLDTHVEEEEGEEQTTLLSSMSVLSDNQIPKERTNTFPCASCFFWWCPSGVCLWIRSLR